MQDVRIDVPGGRINVWHRPSTGDASYAALIHGLSGNSRWWSSVVEELPSDVGIIALDVRGRAASSDAPPPFDLATIAEDIARSLDHFGLERATIAGYSMGAWIAALFGLEHPDRVERLLLVDGGFPLPRDPEADAEEIIEAVVGPSLKRLEIEFDSKEAFFDYWKGHPAFASYWEDSMIALGHELEPVDGHYRVRANPEAIQVAAREITVGVEANEAAAKLQVPTHLIVVERDTMDRPGGMIPLRAAEEAARANPMLTMQYIPDVNHYTLVLGKGAPTVSSAITAAGWLPSH